jgi:phosphatidylserine/phosphatidylglycerophosphate/cardiolipin synthase-like enzyme
MASDRYGYGHIGSFNLDYWSAHRNLEAALSFVDIDTAAALDAQFLRDLARSR